MTAAMPDPFDVPSAPTDWRRRILVAAASSSWSSSSAAWC